MDWLSFVDHVVDHLAWPIAVILLAFVFGGEIRSRIRQLVSLVFKGFGAEVSAEWTNVTDAPMTVTEVPEVTGEWTDLDEEEGL